MRSVLIRSHTLSLALLVLVARAVSVQELRPALDMQTATGRTKFDVRGLTLLISNSTDFHRLYKKGT
jgi:hypothetical protein